MWLCMLKVSLGNLNKGLSKIVMVKNAKSELNASTFVGKMSKGVLFIMHDPWNFGRKNIKNFLIK